MSTSLRTHLRSDAPEAPKGPAGRERWPQPPARRAGIDEHLVSLLAPASFEAEQYRILRHEVERLQRLRGIKVIAITSPGEGDGKTTTALNLAGALAQAPGSRVLLVEADLRQPMIATSLGMAEGCSPGLVGAILDPGFELEAVVRNRSAYNLSVLPAGPCPSVPYELLRSHRVGDLLDEGRRSYDYVIVDTPPILITPDCRVLAQFVDGFLIVVAANRTPRKLLEEALNTADPEKVLGIVMNGDDQPLPDYYRSYLRTAADRPTLPALRSLRPTPGAQTHTGPTQW
jgi:capsular exopolysaccharide synthesis family protein